MTIVRQSLLAVATLFSVLTPACGGSGHPNPQEPPPQPASPARIEVAPSQTQKKTSQDAGDSPLRLVQEFTVQERGYTQAYGSRRSDGHLFLEYEDYLYEGKYTL